MWGHRPATSGQSLQRAEGGPASDTLWKLKGMELETQPGLTPGAGGPAASQRKEKAWDPGECGFQSQPDQRPARRSHFLAD